MAGWAGGCFFHGRSCETFRPRRSWHGTALEWGAKAGIGTAYSTASRVWYTVAAGILTEVYYPTIDMPQLRDLQFLVSDA